MTPLQAEALPTGLYRLFWIHCSESSLAAVGRDRQARVWYAPANWLVVPWYEWERIERAELIARSFEHTLG
jgi:hypothetical protein